MHQDNEVPQDHGGKNSSGEEDSVHVSSWPPMNSVCPPLGCLPQAHALPLPFIKIPRPLEK